jgi:hypothetical protein
VRHGILEQISLIVAATDRNALTAHDTKPQHHAAEAKTPGQKRLSQIPTRRVATLSTALTTAPANAISDAGGMDIAISVRFAVTIRKTRAVFSESVVTADRNFKGP